MTADKHQSWKQWCCSLCQKLPEHTQSFDFWSQIVTEYKPNVMFLLVSKFKMIGMLLNVVHSQSKKANKNR